MIEGFKTNEERERLLGGRVFFMREAFKTISIVAVSDVCFGFRSVSVPREFLFSGGGS